MPRPRMAATLPAHEANPILQEILIRATAQKQARKRKYDPSLGATWEEAEERIQAMRVDINQYGEYVYGYQPADFHRYWNKIVDDVIYRRVHQNKLLLIAPPNTAKSTWNSIIRATHYLGNNPHEHIINITSSDDNAKEFDTAFALTVEESEPFRNVFPDNSTRPYKKAGWSSDGRYLRGLPAGDRHPTYKSVGLNSSVMGNRANIILDDPMDQKSAQSEAEQAKAKRYLDQTLIPRLQPDTGWMIAVMTRFHEFDLASHMIRLAQESGDWIYIRTPMIAEADDPIGRVVGDLLWEERFNEAFIDQERRRMTMAEFNMVHQGDPTGMGGDVFTSEAAFLPMPLGFYGELRRTRKYRMIVVSDLAFSEKKNRRTCFTVIMTFAIDEEMNMYIVNVFRKRMSTTKVANVFVNIIKTVKPIVVALEADNFHIQLTRTLARTIMSKVMCNIQLIRPDKDKRARALLPAARVENGRVFVDKTREWWPTFAIECLGFPNTRYKDQVDTFGLGAHVVERLEEMMQTFRQEEEPIIVMHSA